MSNIMQKEWTSDYIFNEIINGEPESDIYKLRKMIFVAEDTSFTVAQSKKLAPWLLNFAERYRSSIDPKDKTVVWSAIRTGASMLHPSEVNLLRPLLKLEDYPINTILVTLKMIGRIFEVHLPADIDKCSYIVNDVYHIAIYSLASSALEDATTAAKAQLATYALAAMGSSKIKLVIECIKERDIKWFTKMVFRRLCKLNNIWQNDKNANEKEYCKLLEKLLKELDC